MVANWVLRAIRELSFYNNKSSETYTTTLHFAPQIKKLQKARKESKLKNEYNLPERASLQLTVNSEVPR